VQLVDVDPTVEERPGGVVEQRPFLLRDVEQLGDDRRGERVGEPLVQVDGPERALNRSWSLRTSRTSA
jgi:hypothetical protein